MCPDIWMIILGIFEPPVRILRATLPENESHSKMLILECNGIWQNQSGSVPPEHWLLIGRTGGSAAP